MDSGRFALVVSSAKLPMLRAAPTKVIMPTASSVGVISRSTMRRYVLHHDAPAMREASSSSLPAASARS